MEIINIPRQKRIAERQAKMAKWRAIEEKILEIVCLLGIGAILGIVFALFLSQ